MTTVISGFGMWSHKYPRLTHKLVIVGEGRERQHLEKLAQDLKIEAKIVFTGQLTSRQLAKVAAEAQIGIFMCPNEAFGLSAVESLACGTPVIGVKKNGIAEIVKPDEDGLVIEDSPTALAFAIEKLIAKRKLASMSKTAVREAKIGYDWDNQVGIFYKWLLPQL